MKVTIDGDAATIETTRSKHGAPTVRRFRKIGMTADWFPIWRGQCVVCGADFDVIAPQVKAEESKSFGTTTCRTHREGVRLIGAKNIARPDVSASPKR